MYSTANQSPKLQKAKQVSAELGGIGPRTLYRMAEEGAIPSYRIGRKGVRFNVDEVREALRRPIKDIQSRSDLVADELLAK